MPKLAQRLIKRFHQGLKQITFGYDTRDNSATTLHIQIQTPGGSSLVIELDAYQTQALTRWLAGQDVVVSNRQPEPQLSDSLLDLHLSETIADLERIAVTDEPPAQYYAAVGAIKGFLLYQLATSAQLTEQQRAQIRLLVERWDQCRITRKSFGDQHAYFQEEKTE